MSSTCQNTKPLTQCGVLVVGGSSGVGLATAMMFAETGVRGIVINGRNTVRGEKARQEIKHKFPGISVDFIAGDCNTVEGTTHVCQTAWDALGGIDVLVNSTVGPYPPTLLKDIPLEDLQDIVVKQMMAPIMTSRYLLPLMSANGGGVITNIASDAAKLTTPGESVIGAAMAGIVMFTRTMAMEAKRNGVRVNVITPSIIEGTMTHGKVMSDPFAGKLFAKAIQAAHLGVCVPDDLAQMIVFLSSPAASRVTGQVISVNGGISA